MSGRVAQKQVSWLGTALLGTGLAAYWLVEGHRWAWIAFALAAAVGARRALVLSLEEVQSPPDAAMRARQGDAISVDATTKLAATVAYNYLRFLNDPQVYLHRVKESVEPLSRAVSVSTRYTIRVPGPRRKDSTFVVAYLPVILSRKGDLHDDLSIEMDGCEVPTVTFAESISITARAMRTLVAKLGEPDQAAYYAYESRIIAQMANRSTLAMPSARTETDRLIGAIEARMENTDARNFIISALDVLTENYVIVAAAEMDLASSETWFHISARERLLLVHQYGHDRLAQLAALFRRAYGVRTSEVLYPIAAGYRAESYHLEVMGPRGTYLAKQFPHPTPHEVKDSGYRRLQSRMGQRYLHFYARRLDRGTDEETLAARTASFPRVDRPCVSASFFERPPGSMSQSAVSAVVASVLLVSAYRMSLSSGARSDVVALMLAIPGAVASWSGFERFSDSIAGTLCSRVSSSVTLLACLLGAAQYMIGGSEVALAGPLSNHEAWVAILVVSLVNSVSMSYAWFKRWRIHSSVMKGV